MSSQARIKTIMIFITASTPKLMAGWTGQRMASRQEHPVMQKRLESIQIVLKEKGAPAPGNTDNPYIALPAGVQYMTHVQTFGWQNWVTNGAVSGTEGKAKKT